MSVDKAVKCPTNSSQSGRRQAGYVRRRMTSSSKGLTPTSQVLSGLQDRQSLALRSVRTRRRRSRSDEGRWLTQDSGKNRCGRGRLVRVRRVAAAHGEGDRELGTGWCVQEGQVHKKEEEEKRGMLGVGGGGVVSRKTKSMSNDVEDRTLKSSKPSRHARWRG